MKNLLKIPLLRIIFFLGTIFRHLPEKEFDKKFIKKILIFQLGGIGDVLRIFPAIETFQKKFPCSTIYVLTEFVDNLFELYPHREPKLHYCRYEPQLKHKSLYQKYRFFKSLRRLNFDLIYNSNRGNSIIEASIMSLFINATYRVGFDKNGAGFLNNIRLEFDYHQYILEQNLNLLNKIGITTKSKDINLNVKQENQDFVKTLLNKKIPYSPDIIIAVHPGAKYHEKVRRWPLSHFCELIKKIITQYNVCIILLGSESETNLCSQIISEVNSNNLISVAGVVNIEQTAAIIKISDIFIGNDSGPLHIAIALKTISIGIFALTLPDQVIPIKESHVNFVTTSSKPFYTHQPIINLTKFNIDMFETIKVEQVFALVKKLIHSSAISNASS